MTRSAWSRRARRDSQRCRIGVSLWPSCCGPPVGTDPPDGLDGTDRQLWHLAPLPEEAQAVLQVLRRAPGDLYQLALTAARSLVRESFASPNSRMVLGSYSNALSIPEKPGLMLRFRNTTLAALSTLSMGIP